MSKLILLSLLTVLITNSLCFAQNPHLTGNIEVSIENGIINADLKLENLPKSEEYSIWLNAGLNIEYFRSIDDKFNYYFNAEYNSELSSEAMQYYFPSDDNKSRFLPNAFQVKYTGKFPVISSIAKAYEWGDWKGNMAFNGSTFRASEQSAWYPILYDKKNDLVIEKYTFDLKIHCSDCSTIYANGDAPKYGTLNKFSSNDAVPLLLFMGNYDFVKEGNTFVLNSNLDHNKLKTLSNTTQEIIDFYEKTLKIPYGKPVVYLSTTPVSTKNEWMFVSYPTVAVIGIDQFKLENYFDDSTFQFKQKSNITFIAHELAHYYFGTKFNPNSTLRWFFLEGVTDYVSIKAAKSLLGMEIFDLIVKNYVKEIKDFKPVPLNKILSASEINETYRYRYVPLLLLAFEKELGEEQMTSWLQELVNSENALTNFNFFLKTFEKIGIPKEKINSLVELYIKSPKAKNNVIKALEK